VDKYTKESQFNIIPITKSERTLGFLDSSLVNTGWGIATWCFLTGGLLSTIVDFKTGVICALVGNTIGVVLCSLASSVLSTKYGIDTYTSMNSFLGKNGTKIVFAIFLITNFGWVAVLSSMFARGIQTMYEAFSGKTAPDWTFPVFTIIATLIAWTIVVKGPNALKIMNRIMVPGLLAVTVIMIVAIFTKYSFGDVLLAKALTPYDSPTLNIIFALELNIGAGVSWWPGLGALARLNKTTSSSFWGNILGLDIACVVMVAISMAAAFTIGGSDPTTWMIPLGGVGLGIIALLFIMLANLTSNSYVMYNSCLGMRQYGFFKQKSWLYTTIAFTIPVVILSFFPAFIYGNYQMLLNFCVALFGPLSVIQILDYFVFRKQQINLRAIFDTTKRSDYYYTGGINWGAVLIFAASAAIYCIILNPITWEYQPIFAFTSATLPSCLFCFIAYFIYGKAYLLPKNIGNPAYGVEKQAATAKGY
jgi:NCS1 family nucleobase:cation symporter-1